MQSFSRFRFVRAYLVFFSIVSRYIYFFTLRSQFLNLVERKKKLEELHQKTAQKLVAELSKLKGLYIKIGQTLSVMGHLLPPAIVKELEKLQDRAPEHDFSDVKERLLAEFNLPFDQVFKSMDTKPIAAASLGQVHRASIPPNRDLAVKIKHPFVDLLVKKDLKTLKKIFSLLDLIFPRYQLKRVYEDARDMVITELDFKNEAKNIAKFSKNFRDDAEVIFPTVLNKISTRNVLTMDFIDGIKISDVDEHQNLKKQKKAIAEKLIHTFCKQIFLDGFFHADPHPGNIFVIETPNKEHPFELALIDCGAASHVPEHMREGLKTFIQGIISKDKTIIASALKKMGFVAIDHQEQTLEEIVSYFYDQIKGVEFENIRNFEFIKKQSLKDILSPSDTNFKLSEILKTFHVPRDWVLLERTLMILTGLVAKLDPKLNPFDLIIPYVEEFVLGKDQQFSDLIVQNAKDAFLSAVALPTKIKETLELIQTGKLKVENKTEKRLRKSIQKGFLQISLTLIFLWALTIEIFAEPKPFWWGLSVYRFIILTSGFSLAWQLIRRNRLD